MTKFTNFIFISITDAVVRNLPDWHYKRALKNLAAYRKTLPISPGENAMTYAKALRKSARGKIFFCVWV
jgi:hypothetical protein